MQSNTILARRLFTVCLLFVVTLFLGATAQAQLFTENFVYTTGTNLSANGWTAHSGAGTNSEKVTASGLSYSNYLGNGVGNAASFVGSGEDVNKTWATFSSGVFSGSLYYSAMIRIDTARTNGNGDYFFHLNKNATIFTGRVFIRKASALSSLYAIGIAKSSTAANVAYTDTVYTVGTTYLLAAKYTFISGATNDTMALWVNPTPGGSETTPTLLESVADKATADIDTVYGVAIRQGTAAQAPSGVIDGIRVGTAWADVTPALPSNQYRSAMSGDWNTIGTWEVSTNGGGSWAAAAATPTSADDAITIIPGHTVTVTASVSVDQVTVSAAATLHVNSGNTLTVDNGTGTDVTVNGTLRTAGTVSVNASAVVAVNGGTFQINEGGWGGNTGSYTYNATGKLSFNGTTSYGVNADAVWFPDPIPYVFVENTGGISLNVARTVSTMITATAGITNGGNLTVNGIFYLYAGGYITGSPTYGASSTLSYATGGTYGRGDEWTNTSGPGYPNNVTVDGATTLNYPNGSTAARSIAGNLYVANSSALYMDYGAPGIGNPLTVGGGVTNDGSLSLGDAAGGNLVVKGDFTSGGSFFPNSRTVVFDGTGTQTISGGATFSGLTVNKSSNNLALALADITVNGALTVTSGQLVTGAFKVTLGAAATMSEVGSGNIVLGKVEASRTISSTGVNQTFGGIGMELEAVTGPVPGATTVTRVTGTAQTGAGNQSIKRYYDISTDTSTGLNVTMGFRYNDAAAELNTNVEPTLSAWRSTNSGSTWTSISGPPNDDIGNMIPVPGVTSFSRWTAADATHPLATAASMTSDVVAVASSESATISSIINTPGPLTSSQGTQVWQITIRDGGTSSPDPDALATQLIAMILYAGAGNTITDWTNAINTVDLFDGPTWLASGAVFATSIQFNTLSVSAPDNGTKTLSLRLTLKDPLGVGVADNQRFVFEVSSGLVVSGGGGSLFGGFPNATSSASANSIDVAATALAFSTQPGTNLGTGVNIAPVQVAARDSNGNADTDFANAVTLSSGTFTLSSTDGGGLTQTPSSGVASWANLSSSTSGTGTVLANATGVSQGTSNNVNILGPTVTSATSGVWNSPATWVGGAPPLPTQSAIIANGHTVTLSANDTCAGVVVNSGGILDIVTFQLRLAGTYSIAAGGEGRQGAFNPVPGGGATPWAFDAASTYTIGGAATGFSIGLQPGITFGNLNWSSSGNATPPVGVVVQGNLVKSNTGQLRGGTGATSRIVTVNGNVTVNGGILYGTNSTSPATGGFDIGGDLTINPGGTLGFNLFSGASTIKVGGSMIVNDTGKVITGAGSGSGTLYFKGGATSNFDPGIFAANTFKNIGIPAGRTVNMINHDVTVASSGTVSDTGALYLGANVVKGAGAFAMVPGATLGIGSTDGITTGATGNVQVTGTRTYPLAATYVYNGSLAQVTGNGLPNPVSNVTIANSAGVALSQSTTVQGTLALGANTLSTGAFVVTIDPAGLLTRTTGYVIGNLQRTIAIALASASVATGAGSATFEIGDAAAYTPVFIEGTAYSGDFSVTASTTTGEHPDGSNSGIDTAKSVNRYYTLTGSPTGPTDVTFNFLAGDVDGIANTANFIVGKYDTPNWTLPAVGIKTATSTQATGITSFSEFAIGEAVPVTPDVTFRVDMRPKMLDGFFLPDSDYVEVRGGFNGWAAGDTLTDGDLDSIYTKTLTLAASTSYDYKFYKSPRGAYGWEDGIGNRTVLTGTADTVLPAPYFNDDDFTVPATFSVNMKIKMIEGTFTPPAQGVFVRGNFNNWSGPVGPMTDGDNDSIYTYTTGIPSGKLLEYKFWTDAGLGWESVSNRQFNVLSNTPPTLPVWYFDDDSVANIPGFLVSPSSIAFGSVQIGDSLADSVYVYNTGLASLNVSSITSDNSVFTVEPITGTLAPGESLLVMVAFNPDSAQAESGTITFAHDAAGSPGTVTVSGTGVNVVPTYFLSLSPDSVFNEDPLKPGKSKKPAKHQKHLYPNWSNLLDELNAQGGFAPITSESDSAGGMVIGRSLMYSASPGTPLTPKWKARKELADIFCWVRLAKWDFKKNIGKSYANIQKTLRDKNIGFHTGPVSGFDTTTDGKFKYMKKQLTSLSPKKQNNKLFAELVALKVNIAASAMGKTPAGFGDLIYDMDGNMFDEMSVMDISNESDSMMTMWMLHTQDELDSLYSAVYNINRAFLGPLDTLTFDTIDSIYVKGKLTVAGQVDVNTLSFLKLPALFAPTRIFAQNTEVESPEDFEDEEFDEEGGTPVAAKLYQNYPNPFNPSTTIAFNLREVSTVTVKIYNLLGQEVATLINGEDMDEGIQTLQFSADQLSSGVYFYRIDAQGQDDTSLKTIETRKMVLLK